MTATKPKHQWITRAGDAECKNCGLRVKYRAKVVSRRYENGNDVRAERMFSWPHGRGWEIASDRGLPSCKGWDRPGDELQSGGDQRGGVER